MNDDQYLAAVTQANKDLQVLLDDARADAAAARRDARAAQAQLALERGAQERLDWLALPRRTRLAARLRRGRTRRSQSKETR